MNLKETFADALESISKTAGANTVIGESISTAKRYNRYSRVPSRSRLRLRRS